MAYRMTPVLVTLNDLEGHSPVAGLLKCNPSNMCAAFYQISIDGVLARSLSDSWASCTQLLNGQVAAILARGGQRLDVRVTEDG